MLEEVLLLLRVANKLLEVVENPILGEAVTTMKSYLTEIERSGSFNSEAHLAYQALRLECSRVESSIAKVQSAKIALMLVLQSSLIKEHLDSLKELK